MKNIPTILLSLILTGCASSQYLACPPIIIGCIAGYGKQTENPTSSSNISQTNKMPMSPEDYALAEHTKVNPTQQSLDILKGYGIQTPDQYDSAVAEANNYQDYKSDGNYPINVWNKTLDYLAIKSAAKEKNVSVKQYISITNANAKRQIAIDDANEKRRLEKLNRAYPYTAEITCTFNGNNMPISSCFSPTSISSGTELELQNGQNYEMYQWMQIDHAGSNLIKGKLTIPLSNSFKLKVQNSSNNSLLNVVIKKSGTNKILFQKSAAQWSSIVIGN